MAKSTIGYRDTYIWTHLVVNELRKAAVNNGFIEMLPSIVSRNPEPGAKHSIALLGDKDIPIVNFQDEDIVKVTGKEKYFLPVSHVVEKQMALEFMDKVFCVAPCLRLLMDGESDSGKHLYTFFQFELEWRTSRMSDVFTQGESILVALAEKILESSCIKLSEKGSRNLYALAKGGYPVIEFSQAHEMIGNPPNLKRDFTSEEDQKLTKLFSLPFWIVDYPEGVRDSLYHKNEKGHFDTYDLMLPYGYGELTTGGVRPFTGQEIIEQSIILGKNYSREYAEWKDRVNVQTAGFGIGLERIIKFICGSESILDLVQYHDRGPNRGISKDFFDMKRVM